MKSIKTVCHRDCPDTCFMDVFVEGGKIVKTGGSHTNPVTQGILCPRGKGDPRRVHSPQRVLYPYMKSASGAAEPFTRTGWNAALDKISDHIQTTIDVHGPESVLLYDYPGNTGLLAWHYPKRLWSALGVTTTDYALCSNSGHTGIGLHYGLSYGLPLKDVAKSRVILFWGNNARVSAPHIWALARRAQKKQGAVIVNVDPRESRTAAAADIRIRPRPGSDVALCYGIARYLIESQGIDQAFIDQWATGFEAYAEAASRWTPQRVEQATGVAEDAIARIGDLLMTQRQAAFMIGFGLQKSMHGAEAARAVSLLPALLGQHRGYHYSNSRGVAVDWSYINGSRLADKRGKVVSQVAIGKRLAAGDFKMVYVMGSNPAMTLPDQSAVRQGLDRDDVFVVVHDTHWSETAARADVVLPAPTFFEKRDICIADHHPYCRLSEKAIDPIGQSRHEIQVMQQLATRLALTHTWLYEDPWQAVGKTLEQTFVNGNLKRILDGDVLEVKLKPRTDYPTPSGKIEFAATRAEGSTAPLPTQHPGPGFVLLNSAIPTHTHSQFTDVYGPIPRIVRIHPEDANRLDIGENDTVSVYNDLAAVTLHAVVTTTVPAGTLWCPRPLIGLNGVPLNALVPGKRQSIGNGPIFNSIKVNIKPAVDLASHERTGSAMG